MNQSNIDLVQSIKAMVENVLRMQEQRLIGVGLIPKMQPIRHADDDTEFCVEFTDIHGVADVLEFHAIRDGSPTASFPELEDWFVASVLDVINKAEERCVQNRRTS